MPRKQTTNPSVSIIGAGRLGTALAIALEQAGYQVETIVNRSRTSAKRAAKLLDVPPRVLAAKELAQLQLPDVIVVATPDDNIAETAASLLNVDTANSKRCVVLHTSGALSSRVLASLLKRNWSVGSVHPLISVSTARMSLDGAFWSIEGDNRARQVARKLVRDLNGESFTVNSKQKPLYHVAALMSAGGVVALFDVAIEMMVQSGVERRTSRKVLQPLIESVVASLRNKDTTEVLTGTFSRGDINTVVHHLDALEKNDLQLAAELYKLLGRRSLKLAKQKNLKPALVQDIEALLE